ncbi:hypothetical protein B0T14DRAFT_43524 [Immersiella caudata]|uniref:Uncharacterized protein n=1 Tax=Immersiella caudata TaxID=314043 RepID=A0AA40CC68_9PEZI|nr:hypothetical protein B0T14DRAFT_43524 [Immersiella caudata]
MQHISSGRPPYSVYAHAVSTLGLAVSHLTPNSAQRPLLQYSNTISPFSRFSSVSFLFFCAASMPRPLEIPNPPQRLAGMVQLPIGRRAVPGGTNRSAFNLESFLSERTKCSGQTGLGCFRQPRHLSRRSSSSICPPEHTHAAASLPTQPTTTSDDSSSFSAVTIARRFGHVFHQSASTPPMQLAANLCPETCPLAGGSRACSIVDPSTQP